MKIIQRITIVGKTKLLFFMVVPSINIQNEGKVIPCKESL